MSILVMAREESYCSACGDILETCDECGKNLSEADTVLCVDYGTEHLCSQECFDNWVKKEHAVKIAPVES